MSHVLEGSRTCFGRFMVMCGTLWKVPDMDYMMHGRDDIMHGRLWKLSVI
jgi:hypothetical protein